MSTPAPQARLLRLVPKPIGGVDADMVSFTIMEFIDQIYPEMFAGSPKIARVSLRNTIVRTVLAEQAK